MNGLKIIMIFVIIACWLPPAALAQAPPGLPSSDLPSPKEDRQVILPGSSDVKPSGEGESTPTTGSAQDSEDAGQKRLRTSKMLLAEAWNEYQAGRYDRAASFFQFAGNTPDPVVKGEAELGLAYTYQKLGRTDEVAALFDGLVQKNFQLENTVPGLMNLLLDLQRWDQAKAVISRLPDDLQKQWASTLAQREAAAQVADQKEKLALAWDRLKSGDTETAAKYFLEIRSAPDAEIQKQARLGMGYVAWREGDAFRARDLFEGLFKDGYRVEETAGNLMQILVSLRDVTAAYALLDQAPFLDQAKWKEKLAGIESEQRTAEQGRLLADGWQEFNAGRLQEAQQRFEALVKGPDSPSRLEALLGLGYTYLQTQQDGQALEIFETLVGQGYRLEDTGPRLMDLLLAKRDVAQAIRFLNLLPAEISRTYQPKVFELETALLVEALGRLDPQSPAYRRTAEKVLALDPENESARAGLAWACHKTRDFACALEQFTFLRKRFPQKEDYLLGLVYTLVELKQKDQALDQLETWRDALSPKIKELLGQLYREKAQAAYDQENYGLAEQYLHRVLKIDPGNRELLELLAWTYYRQNKTDEALELFRRLYQESRSPASAQNVIMVLEKAGRAGAVERFLASLAAEKDHPALLKMAGDYYYGHKQPLRAAQTYHGHDAAYLNYDAPALTSTFRYRHKDGDAGLSELSWWSMPLTFRYPLLEGREISLGARIRHLDAGQAPDNSYTGKYYRFIDDPTLARYDLIDSVTVVEPEIGFKKEGRVSWEARLGLTPLGGEIEPALQFKLAASGGDNWQAEIHQVSVTDTLQSYIGQTDPYTGEDWGRVLRTGLTLGKSFDLGTDYWLAMSLGYDYYWGEQVADNHALEGSATIGRTFKPALGDLSTGLFLTARHFDRNSDYYTFGHGGYFSPKFFLISGPFVRLSTRESARWWYDASLSAGYMQYQTHDDTPHYPLDRTSGAGLSAGALSDYQGRYEGEDKSGLAANLNLRAYRLIGDRLAVGGDLGLNTGTNHTEWYGGLALNFYFKKRNKLLPEDISGFGRQGF